MHDRSSSPLTENSTARCGRISKACSNARRGTVYYNTLFCEHLHQIYLSTAQLTLAAGIQSVLSFSRDQLEHETLFVDSSVCPGWHCTYPSRRRLIPLAVCIQILTFLNRSIINYLVRIMYLSNHLTLLS